MSYCDNFCERDGDRDVEAKALTIRGFESAWLANLVGSFIHDNVGDYFASTILRRPSIVVFAATMDWQCLSLDSTKPKLQTGCPIFKMFLSINCVGIPSCHNGSLPCNTPGRPRHSLPKTCLCIAARCWWVAGYAPDIKESMLDCRHYNLANGTDHTTQQVLGALEADKLFDIIAIDTRLPRTTSKPKDMKSRKKNAQEGMMTSASTMTSLTLIAFLNDANNVNLMAKLRFSNLFVPSGMGKLAVIDKDSKKFRHNCCQCVRHCKCSTGWCHQKPTKG
jgi:hypothetical protein